MKHFFFHNWWQKLIALLLAILTWLVISNNQTQIIQRSLVVPLEIEGLGRTQIVSSIPPRVEVTVSGVEGRVDGLTADNFRALLNLDNVQGEFEREISLNLLQGINLVRLNPRKVSGFVETEDQKAIDVRIALFNISTGEQSYQAQAAPQRVLVRGRAEDLSEVSHAMALVPAEPGQRSVSLFPADASGKPLSNISVEPAEVIVDVMNYTVLHEKLVPLVIEPPNVTPLRIENFEASQNSLRIVGPLSTLNDIVELTATTDTTGLEAGPGQYRLEIVPVLPEGVSVLERATAILSIAEDASNQVEEEP